MRNANVVIACETTWGTLAAGPAIILANAIAKGKGVLAVILVTVRRSTSNPDFIDSTLLRNNASIGMALSRVVGTAKSGARCATQVASASRPRAPRINGASLTVITARASPRSHRGALTRLISTARASALNGRSKSTISARPSAPVNGDAGVAIAVACASLPVRRKIVAAHGSVKSIEQSVRIHGHIVIGRASVVLGGVSRSYASPCTWLRIVGEGVVLTDVA